jgi:hypothetical protein
MSDSVHCMPCTRRPFEIKRSLTPKGLKLRLRVRRQSQKFGDVCSGLPTRTRPSVSKKSKNFVWLCSRNHTIQTKKELKFWNSCFDKKRLKTFVSWFLKTYGERKTIELLEQLKNLGFGYATQAGVSLGIDDLLIPPQKMEFLYSSNKIVFHNQSKYKNAKITAVEKIQLFIDTWNETSENLKKEVIRYFEKTNIFNPVYMMAFSGARGNISQVRQLVGMRGLMSDPQGNIIDFPIQSNFREGLTLTEYIISTYGARKGIVDTALRTATAGYLTRRLVDVAQHVMISLFDCKTNRGIFLFDMKEGNQTLYAFQNRLIGRVLANDIKINTSTKSVIIGFRNQEISTNLATKIAEISKKAFVRSPLTCQSSKFVCQLCYGWSLSSNKLVSLGETVGVIAAQSIGEPGTQLTMRTFHTGGVFSGGLTESVVANYDGWIEYLEPIPGTCVRTLQGKIAFLTKAQSSFVLKKKNWLEQNMAEINSISANLVHRSKFFKEKSEEISFHKIPGYALLFARHKQRILKKQIVAQFSSAIQNTTNIKTQKGNAEQTIYADLEGEIFFNQMDLLEQKSNYFMEDTLWKSYSKSKIWILSGKIYQNSLGNFNKILVRNKDFVNKNSVFERIFWYNSNNIEFSLKNSKKLFSFPQRPLGIKRNLRGIPSSLQAMSLILETKTQNHSLKKTKNFGFNNLLIPQKPSSIFPHRKNLFLQKTGRKILAPNLQIEKYLSQTKSFYNQNPNVQAKLYYWMIASDFVKSKAKWGKTQKKNNYGISLNKFKNYFFYSSVSPQASLEPFRPQAKFGPPTLVNSMSFSSQSQWNLYSMKSTSIEMNPSLSKWNKGKLKASKMKTKPKLNKFYSFKKISKNNQSIFYNHSKLNFNKKFHLIGFSDFSKNLNLQSNFKNSSIYEKNKWLKFVLKFKAIKNSKIFLNSHKLIQLLAYTTPYIYQYNISFRSVFKRKYSRTEFFSSVFFKKKVKSSSKAQRAQASLEARKAQAKLEGKTKKTHKNLNFKLKNFQLITDFKNQQKFIPNFYKKIFLKYNSERSLVCISSDFSIASLMNNPRLQIKNFVYKKLNQSQKSSFSKKLVVDHTFGFSSNNPMKPLKFSLILKNPNCWYKRNNKSLKFFYLYKNPNQKSFLTDYLNLQKKSNSGFAIKSNKKFASANAPSVSEKHRSIKTTNYKTNCICFPQQPLGIKGSLRPEGLKRSLRGRSASNVGKNFNMIEPGDILTIKSEKIDHSRILKKNVSLESKKLKFSNQKKFLELKNSLRTKSVEKILKTPILFLPLSTIRFHTLSYVFHLKKIPFFKYSPIQNDKILTFLPLNSEVPFQSGFCQKKQNIFLNTENISPNPRSVFQWFCSDSKIKPGLFVFSKKSKKWNCKNNFWIQKKRFYALNQGVFQRQKIPFPFITYDKILFKNFKTKSPTNLDEFIKKKTFKFKIFKKKHKINRSIVNKKSDKSLAYFSPLSELEKPYKPISNISFQASNLENLNTPLTKFADLKTKKKSEAFRTNFHLKKFSVSIQTFHWIAQQNFRFSQIQKSFDKKSVLNNSKVFIYLVNPQGKKKFFINRKVSGLMKFSEKSFPLFQLKYLGKQNNKVLPRAVKGTHRNPKTTQKKDQVFEKHRSARLKSFPGGGEQDFNLVNQVVNKVTHESKKQVFNQTMFFISSCSTLNKNQTSDLNKNQTSFILNFELKNIILKNLKNKLIKKTNQKNLKKTLAKNLNQSSSKIILAQTKIKKFFTCLSYEKTQVLEKQKKSIRNIPFLQTELKQKKCSFYSSKLDVTLKPGWVYIFTQNLTNKNFLNSKIFHYHQFFINSGKNWIHDINFEQNSVYIENCNYGISSDFSMEKPVKESEVAIEKQLQTFDFSKKNPSLFHSILDNLLNTKNIKLFKNVKCRYLVNFISKKTNLDSGEMIQSKIALFIRPIHSKILPNSFSYKNFIFEANTTANTKISLDLMKDYHSNLLNKQFSSSDFFSSSACFDFELSRIPLGLRQKRVFWFNHHKKAWNFKKSKKVFYNRKEVKNLVKKYLTFKLVSFDFSKKNPSLKLSFQTNHFSKIQTKNFIKNNFFQNCHVYYNYKNFFCNSFQLKSSFHKNFYFNFPISTIQVDCLNFSIASRLKQSESANLFADKVQNLLIKNFNLFPSLKWFLIKKIAYLGKQRFFLKNSAKLKHKNSFVFYKFNTVLKNQVFATTDILSPFQGEFIEPCVQKTLWWNDLSKSFLTIKKEKLKHGVFLTKKDMFSVFIPKLDYFSQFFTSLTKLEMKSIYTKYSFLALAKLNYGSVPITEHFSNQKIHTTQFSTNKNQILEKIKAKFCNILIYSKNLEPKILQFYFNKNEELNLFLINKSTKIQNFNKMNSKQRNYNFLLKKIFLKNFNNKNSHESFSFIKQNFEIQKFFTKYKKRLYKLKGLCIGKPNKFANLCLGNFLFKGDLLNPFVSFNKTGQIIHLNSKKITLRYAQCFLVSANGMLHVQQADPIFKNAPIVTLPFDTFTTGDIVQGIPKVEQYLEARTTQNGRPFLYSLPILLQGIFKRYCTKFPLEQAVSQSFLKIQLIIVDGVQRVYRSQGVSIADKHLEVIVKQMTSKVQIVHGGQTGFFPGELVELEIIEHMNSFLMIKIQYEPIVLGITRASLEVESFLSAASFQQTTKILAKASLYKKKDFLKGLKENILIGNLIPAGTGYMNVI